MPGSLQPTAGFSVRYWDSLSSALISFNGSGEHLGRRAGH
jgi:hypothetical protein